MKNTNHSPRYAKQIQAKGQNVITNAIVHRDLGESEEIFDTLVFP